jgi:putative transposase
MEKAYKFRIYPNRVQENLIRRTFGCSRYVYNRYLAKRKEAYETDKVTLNYIACSRDLTSLKRKLPWLCEVDSTSLQSTLRNLNDAYQNFFRCVRKDEKGFPKFKRKRDLRRSYTSKYTNGNIKVLEKQIRLPKLGLVKCDEQKFENHRFFNKSQKRLARLQLL